MVSWLELSVTSILVIPGFLGILGVLEVLFNEIQQFGEALLH